MGNTYVVFDYQDVWASSNYSIVLKKFDSAGTVLATTYPSPYTANNINAPTAITLNNTENKIYCAGNYKGSQTFGTTNINASTPKVFFNELNSSILSAINENFGLEKSNLLVSPNPFSIETVLQADNGFKNATLMVYNSFGQTVKQIKNINGQTVTLYRDNLPCGLYFVRLIQDNKAITADKLIILTDARTNSAGPLQNKFQKTLLPRLRIHDCNGHHVYDLAHRTAEL